MTGPAPSGRVDRLPAALLAYSVTFAGFLLVPPYLKTSVGPPTAFTLREAADLLTPLVVIPLAWLVFDLAGGLGRRGLVAFLVVAALWVEGQGIHLAANAIGDAFPHDAARAFDRTVPGDLDLWLDETLSHRCSASPPRSSSSRGASWPRDAGSSDGRSSRSSSWRRS